MADNWFENTARIPKKDKKSLRSGLEITKPAFAGVCALSFVLGGGAAFFYTGLKAKEDVPVSLYDASFIGGLESAVSEKGRSIGREETQKEWFEFCERYKTNAYQGQKIIVNESAYTDYVTCLAAARGYGHHGPNNNVMRVRSAPRKR